MQFFALGGESWYFIVSVDLFLNLVLSPFGSPERRIKYYHAYVLVSSLFTGLLLAHGEAGDPNNSWGPAGSKSEVGTYLIMHICWVKRFGVAGSDANLWSGWTFFYGPASVRGVQRLV